MAATAPSLQRWSQTAERAAACRRATAPAVGVGHLLQWAPTQQPLRAATAEWLLLHLLHCCRWLFWHQHCWCRAMVMDSEAAQPCVIVTGIWGWLLYMFQCFCRVLVASTLLDAAQHRKACTRQTCAVFTSSCAGGHCLFVMLWPAEGCARPGHMHKTHRTHTLVLKCIMHAHLPMLLVLHQGPASPCARCIS